jgi:hypothetical protein
MAEPTPPEGGFLSRWSQRKAQARTNAVVDDFEKYNVEKTRENTINIVADSAIITRTNAEISVEQTQKLNIDGKNDGKKAAPGPTLDDVAQLTADSDYSAFTARSTDPQVRNAAMRKLFSADPHFNVMDGLDVYIDDYSVGEPIPKAMLRQMVQARSLGLLDDDLEDQDKPSSADAPAALAANDTGATHENADLQLQRDDAAGHTSAAEGAEPPAEPAPFTDAKPDPGLAAEPGGPRPG